MATSIKVCHHFLALFIILSTVTAYADNTSFDVRLIGTWSKNDGSILNIGRDGQVWGAKPHIVDYRQKGKYRATATKIHLVINIPIWFEMFADDVDTITNYRFEGDNVLVFHGNGEETRFEREAALAAN